MRVFKISSQFTAFVMSLLFMACMPPTTTISSMWKDEKYQVRTEKVLVIYAFNDPVYRRQFEDGFVTALKDRRIDAVVSYTVMPNISAPVLSYKDVIAAQAKAVGADALFINRPLGTKEVDFWVNADGTDEHKLYMQTQTDIYDIKANKLVFSVLAETRIKERKLYSDQIQSYTRYLVNMMSQAGLF